MMTKDGLPKEFLSRMQALLGPEYASFLEGLDRPLTRSLRLNAAKGEGAALPFPLERVPWEERGCYFTEPEDSDYSLDVYRPGKNPLHEAGAYYIQEASAMSAVAAGALARPFDRSVPERVLDLCAAPGGKTTQLYDRMGGQGFLAANEIMQGRAKILSRNIERMGASALVLNETPQSLLSRFPAFFDRVLTDAPCSGEGMFKKEEDALTGWSLENIEACAKRQDEILDAAAGMVKPGGQLIYSTCTFAGEECEGSVSRFLSRHPDYVQADLPALFGERMEAFGFRRDFGEGKGIRLLPGRVRGEGHFVAVLERQGTWRPDPVEGSVPRKGRRGKGAADPLSPVLASYLQFEREVLAVSVPEREEKRHGSVPALFGENLCLVPLGLSLEGLRTLRPGLVLGSLHKDRFVPDHALAMALTPSEVRGECLAEVDFEGACAYLRGESLPDTGHRGWVAVTCGGVILGFGKAGGGRINNAYPKGLRRPY